MVVSATEELTIEDVWKSEGELSQEDRVNLHSTFSIGILSPPTEGALVLGDKRKHKAQACTQYINRYSVCLRLKLHREVPWRVWLSCPEHRPVNWKMAGSVWPRHVPTVQAHPWWGRT